MVGPREALAVFAAGVLAAAFAAPGHAADSFQGSVWSLTYNGSPLPDADPLHETFRITLGVDTDLYNGGGSFLDQIAIKVSSSLFGYALVAAPSSVADWTLQQGGINANGCSGEGSGFLCAESELTLNAGKGAAVTTGNGAGIDHFWVFDLTLDNGTLFTAANQASIKARFVDAQGAKVGDLVSEHISLVPEPGSYALLLAGLGLLGVMVRRRRAQR